MERSCELLHIRFFCMHSYVNRIVITRCRESPQPHWKRGRKCKDEQTGVGKPGNATSKL